MAPLHLVGGYLHVSYIVSTNRVSFVGAAILSTREPAHIGHIEDLMRTHSFVVAFHLGEHFDECVERLEPLRLAIDREYRKHACHGDERVRLHHAAAEMALRAFERHRQYILRDVSDEHPVRMKCLMRYVYLKDVRHLLACAQAFSFLAERFESLVSVFP